SYWSWSPLFPIDSLITIPIAPGGIKDTETVASSLNIFTTTFDKTDVVLVVARSDTIINDGRLSVHILSPTSFNVDPKVPAAFCDTLITFEPESKSVELFPQPLLLHSGQADSVYILANGVRKPVNISLGVYSLDMQEI